MTYSHSNLMHEPVVLFNLKHFNRIVDFLLGTSEETSKSVNKLIIDCARWQVMTLVLHWSSLYPFIFRYDILLNRIESLFTAKSTENKHISFAESDCMSVAGLTHRLFSDYLVFREGINSSIFLRRWAATSNQNFKCWKSNRCWALVKLANVGLIQFLETPFIFIYIVTEWNLRVYIVSKQKNLWVVLLSILHI